MKYIPEDKAKALSRIREVGVRLTSQELNISMQTLYKWQREPQGEVQDTFAIKAEIPREELRQLIQNEKSLETTLNRLERENAALRDENAALRQTIAQLKSALVALLR